MNFTGLQGIISRKIKTFTFLHIYFQMIFKMGLCGKSNLKLDDISLFHFSAMTWHKNELRQAVWAAVPNHEHTDSSALICKRNVVALWLVVRTTGLSTMETVALGTVRSSPH
jgi:hypothetical protein